MHRLFGNRQPGAIANLRDADIALGVRIDKTENHAEWFTGVWVGASSVVIVVFALIKYIFHRYAISMNQYQNALHIGEHFLSDI